MHFDQPQRPEFTRRAALGIGLSSAISGLFPDCTAGAPFPTPDALHTRFLNWSRTATGFADLSLRIAESCMKLVLASGISREDLSDLEPAAYRGTPVEKRLLAAWYTGVFMDGSSAVRLYDATLMWRAAGLDPPPSTCDIDAGRWASAPSNL